MYTLIYLLYSLLFLLEIFLISLFFSATIKIKSSFDIDSREASGFYSEGWGAAWSINQLIPKLNIDSDLAAKIINLKYCYENTLNRKKIGVSHSVQLLVKRMDSPCNSSPLIWARIYCILNWWGVDSHRWHIRYRRLRIIQNSVWACGVQICISHLSSTIRTFRLISIVYIL